jgi:hypothetical protein
MNHVMSHNGWYFLYCFTVREWLDIYLNCFSVKKIKDGRGVKEDGTDK